MFEIKTHFSLFEQGLCISGIMPYVDNGPTIASPYFEKVLNVFFQLHVIPFSKSWVIEPFLHIDGYQ
jgi:hypothetical protein